MSQEDAINAAQRAAAQRFGTGVYMVDKVEPAQWGNSALGFPQPGVMYASAVVRGYKVTLSGGGQSHMVLHVGERGRQLVWAKPR